MTKKLFLIAMLILGCSVYTYQGESKSSGQASAASLTGNQDNDRSHRYAGPFKIVNSRYVSRSSIRHSISQTNGVRIKLMQNGIDNTDIEDFSMAYDSGNEYRMGNIFGIDNAVLPLYVKITYRSWNTFHAVQVDVVYEFMIFGPGTWDITLFN
jgi:hypothetical protein